MSINSANNPRFYRVEVNSKVLEWAIEYCGRKNMLLKKFPKLNSWLEAKEMPTIHQLEELAKMTFVPLGYFFLDEPPKEEIDIPYFRTQGDQTVKRLSPELVDTIQLMKRRQNWLSDYFKEKEYEKLPFVKSFTINDDVKTIADDIRKVLRLEKFWASKFSTWVEALSYLQKTIEDARIMVIINSVVGNNTHRKLDPNEFRGFVLVDEYASLIFVNGADSKSAQMFTIAHELVHIWVGNNAVFDLKDLQPADDEVEQFCNKVVAEFLVPEEEFRQVFAVDNNIDETMQKLARTFKVSELVIARRAVDLGHITKNEYKEFYENYLKKEKDSKQSTGGDFYLIQQLRLGRVFSETVVRAVKEGKLLYREAYRLTGLYGETFEKFARFIETGERT